MLILQIGVVVGERISKLSEKDRTRLAQLLRESRGWPGSLGSKDRAELGKLLGKLDVTGMGREVVPLVQGARRGGKRH
jgi:hypothetical protein